MDLPTGLPPNPPWFKRTKAPLVPLLEAKDANGRPFELPYLRFALTDDEPVVLGTTERDALVYVGEIKAKPAPPSDYDLHIDDDDLEELYLDHPFNWAVNFALYRLGDAGVLVDVYRLRKTYAKLKNFKTDTAKLRRIIEAVQTEVEGNNKEIQTFVHEVEELKGRLVQARVRSRIVPMLLRLHIEGIALDPIYPYGSFDEAPSQPNIVVTPEEETLPRRPPTPFAYAVPSSEGTPYIPSTPSEGRSGPPLGQGIPAAVYTDDLGPRVMDYTAGRSGAPHHRPQPFDTEPLQQWHLPHIPPTEPPKENPPFLGFAPPRCYFCRDVRHVESDCLEPHQCCKRARQCVVPQRHPHFEQLCPFGAERGRWQTTAGRLRHTVSEHNVPSPKLRDILVEDAFDADSDYDREVGKCADRSPSPQGPTYPKDSLLLNPGTPSTTQPTEYWDNFELQTLNFQSPTTTFNNPPTDMQQDPYDPVWPGPSSPPIT